MDIASLLNTPPISRRCLSEEPDETWVQTKPQSTGTTWSPGEATLAAKLDISRALPGRPAHRRNSPLDHRRRWSAENIALPVTLVRDEKPWTEVNDKLEPGIDSCRDRNERLTGARSRAGERHNWVRDYNLRLERT
jgi:hypothetical protein